jgi:endonuclease-3
LNILSRDKDLKLRIIKIIHILRKETKQMPPTMISVLVKQYGKDPFLILISCLLSLRTRDTLTLPICINLFKYAKTPQEFLKIPVKKLEKLIYPVGFYRKKAQIIHHISKEIIERFNGKVPSNEADLLSLKGVGIKTANLVLGEAFGIPAIVVDTHVHRISNMLGLVSTKTPEETEKELKKIIPKKYWIEWARLLVTWGQNTSISKFKDSELFKYANKL